MNSTYNRKLYLKRLIFAFLIVLTAVLQNTKGLFSVFSVHAMVVIPLTVCIAMFEKSIPALFFGVFAGIMCDMTSITTDGFFSAALAVVAFTVAVVSIFYVRNNIFSCMLMSFVSILLVNTLYWVLFIAIRQIESSVYIYFRYYFSSAFFTFIFTPIYYYIIRAISESMQPEKKRINY